MFRRTIQLGVQISREGLQTGDQEECPESGLVRIELEGNVDTLAEVLR